MKKYEISEQEAQMILNYLATCPYGQVHELVSILMRLPELKEKKDAKS